MRRHARYVPAAAKGTPPDFFFARRPERREPDAISTMTSVATLSIISSLLVSAATSDLPVRAQFYPIVGSAPIATSPLGVAREALTSFTVTGTFAFCSTSLRALGRQGSRPLLVGLKSARRWGGTSAGFSGGRALGQLIFKRDDVYCAMLGAACAGAAGATSADMIPTRMVTFAAMAIVLDRAAARRSSGALLSQPSGPKRVRREAGPGQVPKSLGNPYGIRVLPPDEANKKVWREVSELYPWLKWLAERVSRGNTRPGA